MGPTWGPYKPSKIRIPAATKRGICIARRAWRQRKNRPKIGTCNRSKRFLAGAGRSKGREKRWLEWREEDCEKADGAETARSEALSPVVAGAPRLAPRPTPLPGCTLAARPSP